MSQSKAQIKTIYSSIENNHCSVFRVEYLEPFPTPICEILQDNFREEVPSLDANTSGFWVEYGYKRAIIDPELYSIKTAMKYFEWERQVLWVRKYTRIFVEDTKARPVPDLASAEKIIALSDGFNTQVHEFIRKPDEITTLLPTGVPEPIATVPIRELSESELEQLSEERRLFFPLDQLLAIQSYFAKEGRDPTDGELEMLAQSWCDHCSHTTWKSLGLMKMLQTSTAEILKTRKDILSVFEDNAGVMSFYEGTSLAIKGETHNSPTMLAPAPGVETMLGGVLRDILGCGKGFYPIGSTWIFASQSTDMPNSEVPKGCHHPHKVVSGMIQGFEAYTNPMGIPNIGGRVFQHNGFAKPFALGVAIGIGKEDQSVIGKPEPGDLIIVLGGDTGRDGIHGATTSSSNTNQDSAEKDGAHVQIGTPVIERYFMTAIMKLRDQGLIRAITDFGAGGLSSAAGEMGNPSGIEIELTKMPLKYAGLSPWEILLSESQERMLLCSAPENLTRIQEICEQDHVPCHVVGHFTDSKMCQINYNDEPLIRLPFNFIHGGCPIPKIEPNFRSKSAEDFYLEWRDGHPSKDNLLEMISHPDIADQSPFGKRFDSSVQGMVYREPYGDNDMPYDQSVLIPLYNKPYAAITGFATNPGWSSHPANMTRASIIASISKCVATGTKLTDIVLCDNFYTPPLSKDQHISGELVEMLKVCSEISRELKTPFISGKDSSSGSHAFKREDESQKVINVPPTLCVTAMGKMPHYEVIPEKVLTQSNQSLWLFAPGISCDDTGSIRESLFSKENSTFHYQLDLKAYANGCEFLYELIQQRKVAAISTLEQGGGFQRAVEMFIGSNVGVTLNKDDILFRSLAGAFLIASDQDLSNHATQIGSTTKEPHLKYGSTTLEKEEVLSRWRKPWQDFLTHKEVN